jgi:hypothetical protein
VLRRLLLVAYFVEVGLLLMVLPWLEYWETNYFAAMWPALRFVLVNDFVRGAVSGLGVLNLLAGLVTLAPMFAASE